MTLLFLLTEIQSIHEIARDGDTWGGTTDESSLRRLPAFQVRNFKRYKSLTHSIPPQAGHFVAMY